MNTVMEAPVEVRCRIEEVFTRSFIDLLAMAPRNCIVRGLILALTRKMPPEECQSYDEVKAWVEANCEKRLGKGQGESNAAIRIDIKFSDTETGRASYSLGRNGQEVFELETEEIIDLAEEIAGDGGKLDGLVEAIAAKITEDAWNRCLPGMDDGDGDYDYYDHDSEDSSNRQVKFSKLTLKGELLRFLGQYHPNLLEELQ
jgi:hypothetical protein